MSTIRNPVGPQSPQVYWRRRLLLVLGVIAVIVVIILIVVRPGSGAPGAAQTPGASNSGSQTPAASETAIPQDTLACNPDQVSVTAATDATDYAPGVPVMISLSVKSIATTDCTIEAGSDVQSFVITSGDEVIWNSKDCQSTPEARLQLLKPGVPVSTTPFAWDRTRSSTETCDTEREQVIAAGASYHLEVALGDIKSPETKQFILN